MADLIIFDCDGTLVDSEPLHLKATLAEIEKAGFHQKDIMHLLGTGLSMPNLQSQFEELLDTDLGEGFIPAINETYQELLRNIDAAEGVEMALNNLMHIKKCVASNGELINVQKSIEGAGIAHHFEKSHVLSADMVENAKPAPDLFLHALEVLEVSAERAVVIEDTVTGIKAAKAAGIAVIGFAGASHSASEDYQKMLREAGADIVITNMAELPSIIQG